MARFIVTFVLLFAVWLSWSGHYTPLMLGFGIGSCLFVAWLARRMDRIAGVRRVYNLGLRWIPYGFWLLWEIGKSNLAIARAILSPSLPIQPQLVRVKAGQKTPLGVVIYANSITLTPGTITLDVRDGEILVHALTDGSAAGLRTGEMDRRVTALEGRR